MAENDFEKTEAPTPRKRQEARNEGNVAKSMDLTAACTLLASVLLLNFLGSRVLSGMRLAVEAMLSGVHASNPTRLDDLGPLVVFSGRMLVAIVLPLLLGVAAVALVVTVAQVGFMVTSKPLTPNFGKLSPIKGMANLFNARGGIRLIMSLAKVAVIGGLATLVIVNDMDYILHLGELTPMQAFGGACELVYALALKLAALLLVLAIMDYAFQKWQHERDLRMSKHDIKEEMKRMEGDPMVKQRRARVAKQLAMQRLAQAVPGADVIVTNPTHFAIALQYDGKSMRAPKVIGKGADFMAMRIRQIASLHGIPIIERKELARALYKSVDVGQEVPPEHYAAIAEILAYVYRLSGSKNVA